MNLNEMSIDEKKEVIKSFYLNEAILVNEVLAELKTEINDNSLELQEPEKSRIEKIVLSHFEKYDAVFKALA